MTVLKGDLWRSCFPVSVFACGALAALDVLRVWFGDPLFRLLDLPNSVSVFGCWPLDVAFMLIMLLVSSC